MLKIYWGWIFSSDSNYASPVVVVCKKDETLKFVVIFTPLIQIYIQTNTHYPKFKTLWVV